MPISLTLENIVIYDKQMGRTFFGLPKILDTSGLSMYDQSIDGGPEKVPLLVGHDTAKPAIGTVRDVVAQSDNSVVANIDFVKQEDYDNAKSQTTSFLSCGFRLNYAHLRNADGTLTRRYDYDQAFDMAWRAKEGKYKEIVFVDISLLEVSFVGRAASLGSGVQRNMSARSDNAGVEPEFLVEYEKKMISLSDFEKMGYPKRRDCATLKVETSESRVADKRTKGENAVDKDASSKETLAILSASQKTMDDHVKSLPESMRERSLALMPKYLLAGDVTGFQTECSALLGKEITEKDAQIEKLEGKEEQLKKGGDDEGELIHLSSHHAKVKGAPRISVTAMLQEYYQKGAVGEKIHELADHYGLELSASSLTVPNGKEEHLFANEIQLFSTTSPGASAALPKTILPLELQASMTIFDDMKIKTLALRSGLTNISIPPMTAALYDELEEATKSDPTIYSEVQKAVRITAGTLFSLKNFEIGSAITDFNLLQQMDEGIKLVFAKQAISGAGTAGSSGKAFVGLLGSSFVKKETPATIIAPTYSLVTKLLLDSFGDSATGPRVFATTNALFTELTTVQRGTSSGQFLANIMPIASNGASHVGNILGIPCYVNDNFAVTTGTSYLYIIRPNSLVNCIYGGKTINWDPKPASNSINLWITEYHSLLVRNKDVNRGHVFKNTA